MKVRLSNFYWSVFCYMVFCLIVVQSMCLYWSWGVSKEDIITNMLVVFPHYILLPWIALQRWKFLTTIQIDENRIRSFLFGRLKCEVDVQKKVYYRVFKCIETHNQPRDYIAISNEEFAYVEKKRSNWYNNSFIDCCDIKRIIILPYDKQSIKSLLHIEEWSRIE